MCKGKSGKIRTEYLGGSRRVEKLEQILLAVAENNVFHGTVVTVALYFGRGWDAKLSRGDLRQGEKSLFFEAQIIVHDADPISLQFYVSLRHIIRHDPKTGEDAGKE